MTATIIGRKQNIKTKIIKRKSGDAKPDAAKTARNNFHRARMTDKAKSYIKIFGMSHKVFFYFDFRKKPYLRVPVLQPGSSFASFLQRLLLSSILTIHVECFDHLTYQVLSYILLSFSYLQID